MPLDPYFADRLRRERRYWIRQALHRLKSRFGWPWFMRPSAEEGVRSAPPAEKGRAKEAARKETRAAEKAGKPHPSQKRAAHRKQAKSWDRKELAKSGTPGPRVRTVERTVPVDGYPDVRVRIHYPTATWDPATDGPIPACLTFFGGAFRIGGIDYATTDAANRLRAADARSSPTPTATAGCCSSSSAPAADSDAGTGTITGRVPRRMTRTARGSTGSR